MKIGFDWGGVLDTYQEQFMELASALSVAGHHLYVISAVSPGQNVPVRDMIENSTPGYWDGIVIVECASWDEQPQAKLEAAQKLGIDWFFDDREDTNIMLRHHGILAFTVPRVERQA